MRLTLPILVAGAVAVLTPQADASAVPPGAILDLAAATNGGASPTTYTQYQATFTAQHSDTIVSFAFQDVPGYISFDDASVTSSAGGPNLLRNPGFESSMPGSGNPYGGWGLFVQPGVSQYATVWSGVPDGNSSSPHSGNNFWRDGSFGGYDGLAQAVPTQIGQSYTVSFWLATDTGGTFDPASLDTLVYAGQTGTKRDYHHGLAAAGTGFGRPARRRSAGARVRPVAHSAGARLARQPPASPLPARPAAR